MYLHQLSFVNFVLLSYSSNTSYGGNECEKVAYKTLDFNYGGGCDCLNKLPKKFWIILIHFKILTDPYVGGHKGLVFCKL
jgi:hypothetical protein